MIFDIQTTILIGVIAVFLVDRIVSVFKSRGIDLQKMTKHIEELHTWHNRTDEEGVPVWYVRKSLEQAIINLAENSQHQTQLLEKMNESSTEFRKYLVDRMK